MWFLYVTVTYLAATVQVFGPYETSAECEDIKVEFYVLLSQEGHKNFTIICEEGRG